MLKRINPFLIVQRILLLSLIGFLISVTACKNADSTTRRKGIDLVVDSEGILWNEERIDFADLENKLNTIIAESPDTEIRIKTTENYDREAALDLKILIKGSNLTNIKEIQ